jgi:signal transduction histidine kinase
VHPDVRLTSIHGRVNRRNDAGAAGIVVICFGAPVAVGIFVLDANSTKIAWRAPSLRGRVTFLAITVTVLLAGTLLLLVSVLRSSQASLVARSNKHLNAVVHALVNAYENRADRTISLNGRELPVAPAESVSPPSPPTEPNLFPALPPVPPRPPTPRFMPGDPQMTALTSGVLQDETGIEGGFYRGNGPPIVGYAFPTHEGPGDQAALPARETPLIVNLAQAAMRGGRIEQSQFYGTHDVVLFVAAPVCESKNCDGGAVGAAWLMQRIPGAESDRRRALLWSAFGFGTVACITVILAFIVLRQVDQGTRAVLDRLTRMEADLSAEEQSAPVQLAEFHRVMDGLDRLGTTLRDQFNRERELQGRLRQNERLAAIGQLSASVAHDLRNPLATIRLRAQMAQRKTSDEPVLQNAAIILSEVDRLDATIERLLNFSRPVRPNLRETDWAALIAETIARWKARHDAITFVSHVEDDVRLITDSALMQQVLDNVIDNSVHQLTEGKIGSPEITLKCRHDAQHVWLDIEDNAGGFADGSLRNAFEPFFTTRANGTGLGLAICHDIVQALGGTISLRNNSSGAVVRLEFHRRSNQEEV